MISILRQMVASKPSENHWYLAAIGTASQWQGRGYGSRALRFRLAECDVAGMPAYLEATSESNRRLYARHGFEVQRVMRAGGSPPLYAMYRSPKAPDADV
ncbi:MAG: GNAT family N-acetyltransferase [Myxococcota bacterium]